MTNQDLDVTLDRTERLGVIGSPSSTSELAIDILGVAASRKLVGELALFRFVQDGIPHYALGQVTEVELRNIWHEDPTMRSLIRQRGRIDAVSERQDTHVGKMIVSAVFAKGSAGGYEPSILGTVPSTGTLIHVVTDEILNEVLRPYREQLFYLGNVYGSTPKLPMWFKHFASGPGGAGEAYHIGIFGKTGSGKSVLAKMIMLAYARYPEMAIVVLDPQGEFARDLRGQRSGSFALPIDRILKQLNKTWRVMSVQHLVLDRWELLTEILCESPFFERLSIPQNSNRRIAAEVLCEQLQKAKIRLKDVHRRDVFDRAWELLSEEKVQRLIYKASESRARFDAALQDADPDFFFQAYWKPVTKLFNDERRGAWSVNQILTWLLSPKDGSRPVLILDLSKEQIEEGLFWNDRIQTLVIKRLLDGLMQTAEYCYKEGQSLNTLVLIDEAHRLAPKELPADDDLARSVRARLVDAARTTRKYGLGWMFISQTLSSLHTEIIQQMRILFFGFGLGLGQEYVALRQLVGSSGPALNLYQLFRDPHSAFDTARRQYSFMTIGPVSPLSFAGTPLFFNAFNSVEKFMEANGFQV